MKHLFKRVTACLLCMAMLVIPMQLSPVTASAETEKPVLAYVPLDDRPVVVDRVIYGAGSAGFDIVLPPDKSWYQTHLDNQLVNKDNPDTKYTDERQVGNGAAIMDWLEEMEADGCNYYIIHLDMMFSGGLVGSRYPDSHSDADGYLNISEQLAIAERLVAISENPENHVYYVDTVMRLASTGGFKGYENDMYNKLREYCKQARWELEPKWWITQNYTTACNVLTEPGNSIYYYYSVPKKGDPPFNKYGLTDEQIKLYNLARQRKMRLINYMMQYAPSSYYIIGVDDASPKNTIQTNDINFIHARMEAMGIEYSLFADTDSAGLMALSRLVTDYYNDTKIPVKVRYYGDMADKPADGYDIGTLRTNVQSHVECANGVVTDGTGKVELLVLTKISDSHTIHDNGYSSAYVSNINALVKQAKTNIANNIPTIIVDCSTESNYRTSWVKGRSDSRFINLQDELLTKVEISKLMGYSNWNTVGNTLGIAIGQGMARYAYLANESNISASSHEAFLKAMTYAYIKDITYNARNKMSDYTWQFQYWVRYKVGGTGWNDGNFFTQMMAYTDDKDYKEDWELSRGEHVVNNELTYCMMRGGSTDAYTGCGQQVLNAIKAGEIYTDLSGRVTTMGIGDVTVDNFRCPWYRQFEITFDIFVTLEFYSVGDYVTGVVNQETASVFADRIATQLGVSSVVVKDFNGVVAANTVKVGTGFTVTASGKSYTVVIYSDTTGDGSVNTDDVRSIMKTLLGSVTYSAAQNEAADHDGNGKVSSTDARRILQDVLNG